ncbi:MAG: DUF2807 domain-containing protein [Pseudomonadota bacterium]
MRLAYYALTILCFSTPIIAQTASNPLVSKNVATPYFSALAIQGPVNVYINAAPTASTVPTLQLFGDPKTVSAVTWKIKSQTLYLETKWNYWPHYGDRLTIKVNITPTQLNQIRFNSNGSLSGKGLAGSLSLMTQGNGSIKLCTNQLNLKLLSVNGKTNITLHHIHSTNLIIQGKNEGKIKLEGEAALQMINLTGNGNLMLYWVNSPYLKINAAGTGKILLAGIVKTLDIHLMQSAFLFAKSLRADNGFIETQNQAHAEITIRNKLNALAKDDSVIYYSKPVKFLNSFNQTTGLVLAN